MSVSREFAILYYTLAVFGEMQSHMGSLEAYTVINKGLTGFYVLHLFLSVAAKDLDLISGFGDMAGLRRLVQFRAKHIDAVYFLFQQVLPQLHPRAVMLLGNLDVGVAQQHADAFNGHTCLQ